MRYLHSVFVFLFFFLSVFFSFGVGETFAGNALLTQVNPDSSADKIKKMQEIFKGLGLYNGEIDGNFYSIREALVKYQVENGIIPDENHYEAGYFGNKTINSLKKKFGKDFEDLQREYLIIETPKVNQDGNFIVTAYYTPVVGQAKYSTGSYESERKLNGGGNTANGNKPSPGTIAAPKNYEFGTKIQLDGIGVGVVEDRGGSIVNSGDKGHLHDRLDIWMGYGDEGRERTYAWGVRTVKGMIVDASTPVKVNFEDNSKVVSDAPVQSSNPSSALAKYSSLYVSAENPNLENVKTLQNLLKEVNLYSGEINGDFSSVKDILINFQIENGIISSKDSEQAGYFGKKTYEAFKNKFGKNFELVGKENKQEVILYSSDREIQTPTENIQKNDEILTFADKERLKIVRDNFLNNTKTKFNGNEISLENYITNTKNVLNDYLKNNNLDEKKTAILKYFIEIL
ncbi:hypothetical protein D8B46_06875 [Candidatus Gracilibacteria bacterium]|nr:MAG: hypothetical protein D8B46_06875 [Candidatus Gracilibacteria bacterium]